MSIEHKLVNIYVIVIDKAQLNEHVLGQESATFQPM